MAYRLSTQSGIQTMRAFVTYGGRAAVPGAYPCDRSSVLAERHIEAVAPRGYA